MYRNQLKIPNNIKTSNARFSMIQQKSKGKSKEGSKEHQQYKIFFIFESFQQF